MDVRGDSVSIPARRATVLWIVAGVVFGLLSQAGAVDARVVVRMAPRDQPVVTWQVRASHDNAVLRLYRAEGLGIPTMVAEERALTGISVFRFVDRGRVADSVVYFLRFVADSGEEFELGAVRCVASDIHQGQTSRAAVDRDSAGTLERRLSWAEESMRLIQGRPCAAARGGRPAPLTPPPEAVT